MNEFDLIKRYFLPLTEGRGEAAGLQNDTAALSVPEGCALLVTTDSLNEGVHFFAKTPPEVIAQKALRANLSDIAAGGADPYCYQLALALPAGQAVDGAWLHAFTKALAADQKHAHIFCSGGDTTAVHGGVSITVTMMGTVPVGQAVGRSGARAGDVLIVTGAIGAGALAFKEGRTCAPPLVPGLGKVVRTYAQAAIDISDGLLADSAHIAQASGIGLELNLPDVPVCAIDPMTAITGGDDYHIAMAVTVDKSDQALTALQAIGASPAVIGRFTADEGSLRILDEHGAEIKLPRNHGWQHF